VSLPNIVLRKEVFPEFIQHVNPEKIALQVNDMLKKEKKEEMLSLRKALTDLLRGPGRDPYENAAREIFDFLVERYGPLP
jgi:lipid A disaccharide synthetase